MRLKPSPRAVACRVPRVLVAAGLLFLHTAGLAAQEAWYGVGAWDPDAMPADSSIHLGNHRAVVRVTIPTDAVWVHLPWRRRDAEPERKAILVVDGRTGERVRNVARIAINRESGDLVFQPVSGAGEYYIYYLPYTGTVRSSYPEITYPPPEPTADSLWLAQHGLLTPNKARLRFARAELVEFQDASAFDSFEPMELIATRDEVTALLERHADAAYLVFPEDRRHPIRMTTDLPARWARSGPGGPFRGTAERGEFYVFQLGVWAARAPLADVRVAFDTLHRAGGGAAPAATGDTATAADHVPNADTWPPGAANAVTNTPVPGGAAPRAAAAHPDTSAAGGVPRIDTDSTAIPASAFRCFNLGGVDAHGRAFTRTVSVDSGRVQALWCGVQVPKDIAPGTYSGTLTVSAAQAAATPIHFLLDVSADTIRHAGDDEPWRLSRLRWLDSRLAADDGIVPPYTPVEVRGDTIGVLGRRVILGADGLPTSIRSFFAIEMTGLTDTPREVLAAPISLVVEDSAGRVLPWATDGVRFTKRAEGTAAWEARSEVAPLTMELHAEMDFDGAIDFTIAVRADAAVRLNDIRLEIPIAADVARYVMGLGLQGRVRPDRFAWKWDVTHNQDGAWIGDVNAGLQFSLRDDRYVRPLNTNFYLSQPLVMPASWDNGGKGGCRFAERDARTYLVTCYSGPRTMTAGEVQHYDFRLLLTPFHPIDTAKQWSTRYFHAFAPLDSIAALGANTINVHHATPINPWINYPFLTPDTMKAYIDAAHERGMHVKLYYTVRELTNHAPELFALRSLGHEVLASGPGGGGAWLREHVGEDYIAGWHVPAIDDAALVTTGISRWHNFYVEGLHWLVENIGIDGIYLDDIAFDRTTMQRIRKVLARGRPRAMIDLHSANQYNPRDGFASSANLYLEHFPYIDRLWFGEYFDYDSPPAYWLVELSGIPFGLMGEMLQDGGNPWRGMVFGMTARLPWSGDPRPLWRFWDAFGMQQTRMIGYWVPSNPVRTGRDDVLATVYQGEGRALIALASWAAAPVDVTLDIDWETLGIDPAKATITAPAIEGFQAAATFAPGEAVPVAPGKGWLLVVGAG
ncbi:MAG TPA: glycoside hydrolase domain-containing protein, partial [Longimicrobiales bacterium]